MEASPQTPRPLGGGTPPERQLPSGTNKVERIAQHSRELVDDITSWVELKIKLTQIEVQRKVESKIGEVVVKIIPLVVFALCGFFLLVTVALGLGWWLGHPFWGFLIVTVLLGLTAWILKRQAGTIKRMMVQEPRATVAEDRLDGHDTYVRPS